MSIVQMIDTSSIIRSMEHNIVNLVTRLTSSLRETLMTARKNLKIFLTDKIAREGTSTAPINAQPLSYRLSEESSSNTSIVCAEKRNRKKLCPSTGSRPLPLNIPQYLLDDLPKIEKNLNSRGRMYLAQKLQGWNIELRLRASGQDDVYFIHRGRKEDNLRSVPDVIKFILHNELPKDRLPDKNQRKVEAFLKNSFNNLMNNRGDSAYCETSLQKKQQIGGTLSTN
ncbi:hypothetical protein LINGRAPRIM_LOCUS484 [Linum grandiflorum]